TASSTTRARARSFTTPTDSEVRLRCGSRRSEQRRTPHCLARIFRLRPDDRVKLGVTQRSSSRFLEKNKNLDGEEPSGRRVAAVREAATFLFAGRNKYLFLATSRS